MFNSLQLEIYKTNTLNLYASNTNLHYCIIDRIKNMDNKYININDTIYIVTPNKYAYIFKDVQDINIILKKIVEFNVPVKAIIGNNENIKGHIIFKDTVKNLCCFSVINNTSNLNIFIIEKIKFFFKNLISININSYKEDINNNINTVPVDSFNLSTVPYVFEHNNCIYIISDKFSILGI